jgi:hypothetical protein
VTRKLSIVAKLMNAGCCVLELVLQIRLLAFVLLVESLQTMGICSK